MNPRTYQTEAVESLFRYFENNKSGNPVIAMPTGTGKSIVIALFLKTVIESWPNQRILILTHVKELIQQNYEKLLALWPFAPAGIFSAGLNRKDVSPPIVFAGIASICKQSSLFLKTDLIIIDEAHLVSPNEDTMYRSFISKLKEKNPRLRVIGLTATPWRLGHGKITESTEESLSIFTDVCFDITSVTAFNRLIAENFISPLIPKSTNYVLDINDVHMRGGEFIPQELQLAVDKREVTLSAIKEAIELGVSRNTWLVFAAGVDHAIHTAQTMCDLGVPSVAIHSKLSNEDRDRAIRDFKNGKYRAAVNNNMLTTGFDYPAIDMIVCLRPTASSVLWVQMLGRGTRPAKDKENCLVLDFAGNTRRLGPINDPVIPNPRGGKGGEAPIKECPVCRTLVHASLRFCNGILKDDTPCTHEFTFQTKITTTSSTEELIKGALPITEVFQVDHITYSCHRKPGKPNMMKVSYYCGRMSVFRQYVLLEHTNAGRHMATQWWKIRDEGCLQVPTTVSDALTLSSNLKVPTHIRVWINKKYPEILAFCFDGTAFGTKEPSDMKGPSVEVDRWSFPVNESASGHPYLSKLANLPDIVDDDIPF